MRLLAPDQWNQASEARVASGEDGVFEFASVWARDWEFEAEAKRGYAVLKGFTSAVVSNQDVDGVVIRLSAPFIVNGFMEVPGLRDSTASFGGILLLAEVGDSSGFGMRQPDGTVRIEDVLPGRYRVVPAGKMPGYYLDSVLLGSRDITGQAIDLVMVPIRVILNPNPARVRGTVEDCRGETIVLWGLDEPILEGEYFHKTACDASGRFEFGDLRPGDYYACAFAQVGDAYLLQDLAFARALKPRATKVRVGKGQTADVELKLLAWPE